jgi:hypothetical protein
MAIAEVRRRFGHRLRQHHCNADVIRQQLAAEKGIIVSLRTVEQAAQRYRQELASEARDGAVRDNRWQAAANRFWRTAG